MSLPVYTNLVYPTVAVYVDLNRGTASGSIWGMEFRNDPPFNMDNSTRYVFGTVVGINYLGTNVAVNQQVLVDRGKAVLVTQGGINYYLVDQNQGIVITENPVVPIP